MAGFPDARAGHRGLCGRLRLEGADLQRSRREDQEAESGIPLLGLLHALQGVSVNSTMACFLG